MSEQTEKHSYKKTLNLPKTGFSMKANLVQREPEFQKHWDKIGLYAGMRRQPHPKGPFVFHDGPPYANGDIHLGHLLNKVLKDLVVRTKLMAGYDVDFVPGWDCHGLPIEQKVMQEEKARSQEGAEPRSEALEVRRACRKYAQKYVKLQARQMQRLGTIGDYDDPYITMDPHYEAAVLEVFSAMVGEGLVYRALKPVHWSITNRTALADAELEYMDRDDTSVYVRFELTDPSPLPEELNAPSGEPVALMIWTTTPWTLPANLAVAVSEAAEYSLFRYDDHGKTRYVVMAEDLHKQVFEQAGLETAEGHRRLGTCRGQQLVGLTYRHPFCDRTGPVVAADYVTLEDGTGLVHTAPGHGVEDYQTGLREDLDIYCPVRGDGTFDDTAPDWLRGKDVWTANDLVVEHLRESRHLFHDYAFTHSYPHDWRSKTPVIFRATEQWFIGVDKDFARTGDAASLRQRALSAAADEITFLPQWGRARMRGMLESRPDWCISRQRAWGLPIPAFYGPEPGQALLTAASVKVVADVFRQRGSDVWFTAEAGELLGGYDPADDPDAPDWVAAAHREGKLTKARDIFDVWFESGSSWHACMRQRGIAREEGPVTDLYLEGSDQHRGWFQLSLLPALAVTGHSPFATVLTHGFMVDKDGHKMSKSGGNAIEVQDLLKEQGADVCRWWVASLNYENDIKADMEFFRRAGEEYRKVRNTLRFLLSNLNDFDPAADRRELDDADRTSIDGWAMQELNALVRAVRQSYEAYDFRRASEAIFNFCNDTMSAVYLAAVKDRLYCDKPDGDRRRRTQTVLHDITDALVRLIAPTLVHTGEEAWLALQGRNIQNADDGDSVHFMKLPEPTDWPSNDDWDAVMALRDHCMKRLEDAGVASGG